ncbi:MAG: sugar phosphate nucleotidyltransferase [Clostridium sp.]
MNFILLSGGSGKRLWPLSNDVRARQFIKILQSEDGKYESMIQRVCRQIWKVDDNASITVSTSKAQVAAVHNQLEDKVNVCIEPSRRGTFSVIALTAAYLQYKKQLSMDDVVIICPIDPYVEDDYFTEVKKLEQIIKTGNNIALMGIKPVNASENYGYIIPKTSDIVSEVHIFKEKPDVESAKEYLNSGALWNGGIFACRLGYLLEKAHEQIDFTDFEDLYDQYDKLKSVSFDRAVVEKEKNLVVLRYDGLWKDLSTWDALSAEMTEPVMGQALYNSACENLSVVNELNVPILCMGLKNVVVSASAEGILVSDKQQSQDIEPFVDSMNQQVMFAEKSWGDFRVLDVEDGSLTVKISLNPGYRMNYHSHDHRDEVWTIISGTGRTIVDGMEEQVKPGDVITMEAGCKHTVIAETAMQIIEVQLGKEINVHDKHKYELED